MSKLFVDEIVHQSSQGSGTITIGASGETITVPSGATLDLSNATQTGVGGENTPAFWVGQTSDQSYTNNVVTKIVLDNEVYDTHNAFSSNKFTVPSGEGGLYAFNWNVRLDSVSDGATFITSLYKNGSEVNTTRNRDQLGATTDFFHNGAVTLSLAASDYIELYIASSGGSTVTDQSYVYLSGYKIIGV